MKSITFRLSEQHIEELAPLVQKLSAYKSVTVNKATILRMALDIGAAGLRRQVEDRGIKKQQT